MKPPTASLVTPDTRTKYYFSFLLVFLLISGSLHAQVPCQSPASLTFVSASSKICSQTPASFTLDVTGATSATLTSTGTGTFSERIVNAQVVVTYTPSPADVDFGHITFIFRSADPDGEGSCAFAQLVQQLAIDAQAACVPISAVLISK